MLILYLHNLQNVLVLCLVHFLQLLHKYYTVVTIESGDSLWDYASEYGELGYKNRTEYIKEIQSINHLQNIHKLVSGETIVLPYYSYDIL